ncbi:MAG: DUF2235 domain-containing protein [bacterium]
MPKNIVVFSDGTGQEGGKGHNTNIYKLFNMVLDRSPEQIAFYDRGLGTGWRKVAGNVSGMGISKNILECYRFIFETYEVGDQIYLFGFSRGATTVRSLSSFIHVFGMLPKSRHELIEQAYDIYKTENKKERDRKAQKFISKHHTMWCRIKFLGVWDTVAALGLPFKTIDVVLDKIPFFRHKFQDLRLSDSVENAYHALAIDDERLTFHPTLWHRGLKPYQTMKQVWFCGMHTDVGGGYEEHELSDITLEWMIQNGVHHGLKIYPKHTIEITPKANGTMHDSRGTRLTRLYRRKTRTWSSKNHGKPVVHESVLKRKLNRYNQEEPPYSPWILEIDYDVEPWNRLTVVTEEAEQVTT